MVKHFSDKNNKNRGKYVKWITVRSSFFCEYEDKLVRVNEYIIH
jgi:hypothetical protein